MIKHSSTVSSAWPLSLPLRGRKDQLETSNNISFIIIMIIIIRSCLETSLALKKTFEAAILTDTYPHSKIDIFVQILQSDGSIILIVINLLIKIN